MKSAVAIKRYMEQDPNPVPTSTADLAGLKKACSKEEYDLLGQQACEILGTEWEPSS